MTRDGSRARMALAAGLLLLWGPPSGGPMSQAPAAQTRTSGIAGRVILPDGATAEGARVTVYAVRDGRRTEAGRATSAYDGRYEISGLAPGVYIIGVSPSAITTPNPRGVARPARVETFYPDVPDPARAQPITLAPGVPAEGIDIWLGPAPQRYTVGGRVYMPDGVEAKELVIEYGGPGVVRRGLWYVFDPGGLFEIEGAAQGPLVLLARAMTTRGIFMGVASTHITLESVHDVRIVMRPPGRIEGRVIAEREPGHAWSSMTISPVQTLLPLSSLYPIEHAPLAADGRFHLSDALGSYTFVVQGLPDGWTVRRIRHEGQDLQALTIGGGETVTGVEVFVGPGSR